MTTMATFKNFVPSVEFHPGVILAEKLGELGMSVCEFALRSGKPEKTISAILIGKDSVSADMAAAFESVTKIPAHFWMSVQRGFDDYAARQKANEKKREIRLYSTH